MCGVFRSFPFFPLRTTRLTILPFHVLDFSASAQPFFSCSRHFRAFPEFPTFSLRFGPPGSQLFPFMLFLSFLDLFALAQPSHNKSPSCSCHFRAFPELPSFFPLGTTRLTFVPLHAPVRIFRIFSDLSGRLTFDRAPCSVETETQQYLRLAITWC